MQRRNNASAGNGYSLTDTPAMKMRDQNTRSTTLPRLSTSFTVRQIAPTTVYTATAANQFPVKYFKAADLDNFGDLGTVFDQFKIEAIRMTIKSLNGPAGLYTNATQTLVDFMSVIDYNDVGAFGAVQDARQCQTCMTLTPGESGTRVFKPKAAIAVFNGAFTGYAQAPGGWIDMSSGNVQYYGVKIVIPASGAGQTEYQQWEVEYEYYVTFRTIR
jgi:hypothetical protein